MKSSLTRLPPPLAANSLTYRRATDASRQRAWVADALCNQRLRYTTQEIPRRRSFLIVADSYRTIAFKYYNRQSCFPSTEIDAD